MPPASWTAPHARIFTGGRRAAIWVERSDNQDENPSLQRRNDRRGFNVAQGHCRALVTEDGNQTEPQWSRGPIAGLAEVLRKIG